MQNEACIKNEFIYFNDPVQENVTVHSSESTFPYLTTDSRKSSYSGVSFTELMDTFIADALDNNFLKYKRRYVTRMRDSVSITRSRLPRRNMVFDALDWLCRQFSRSQGLSDSGQATQD